jgi:hypothetical protein
VQDASFIRFSQDKSSRYKTLAEEQVLKAQYAMDNNKKSTFLGLVSDGVIPSIYEL